MSTSNLTSSAMRAKHDYKPPSAAHVKIKHIDDAYVVVSKPPGLLSVPGRNPEYYISLESYLREDFGFVNIRIVHRLDMATSGLIVLALNADSHRHLSRQFETRQVKKRYIADIWGHPSQDYGDVNLPLRCDWPNRPIQMVDLEKGKPSLTRWEAITRLRQHTRVHLMPVTGRSHQLRVHMMSIGHPIMGDEFYAHDAALKAAERLCLHASDLSFQHPDNGRMMQFHDPCPF